MTRRLGLAAILTTALTVASLTTAGSLVLPREHEPAGAVDRTMEVAAPHTSVIAASHLAVEDLDVDRGYELGVDLANAPDPQAYLASLSAGDRATLEAAATPVSVQARTSPSLRGLTSGPMTNRAAGCWTGSRSNVRKNVLGGALYSVGVSIRWCTNGRSIYSSTFLSSSGQTHFPGWSHAGRVQSAAAVISPNARAFAQHRFVFGVGGWNVSEQSPCVRVWGSNQGTLNSSMSCGLV